MEQALILDAKNGNTLWADAIAKVLQNVKEAFIILPDGKKAPIGHQILQGCLGFDIKMENFNKARLVTVSYMTEASATIMYAYVVSRETIRIALMITTLDNHEVKLGDC